jgi:hypothetical protein
MKLHKNHLAEAAKYSRTTTGFLFYFKHMFWAIHLAGLLFAWSLLMIVHAIVPQLVGFTIVENIVNLLKQMKLKHPDDPLLKKINFDA